MNGKIEYIGNIKLLDSIRIKLNIFGTPDAYILHNLRCCSQLTCLIFIIVVYKSFLNIEVIHVLSIQVCESRNKVSGQNLTQLSELRRFENLFVLPRVSYSENWVDNFSCVFKSLTTPFFKRGKI